MKITIPPILQWSPNTIPKEEILKYIPGFVIEPLTVYVGRYMYAVYNVFVSFFLVLVRFRLRAFAYRYPRSPFHQNEVEHVYHREARYYEEKHHVTTNFRDTWWRRALGFDVVSYSRTRKQNNVCIVDIGTGLGLSLEEMFRVFREFQISVEAHGLDYNESMLKEAKRVIVPRMQKEGLLSKERHIIFVRGDGRNLTGSQSKEIDFFYFPLSSIDCVTIMCGIGGIDLPYESFREQLMILKEGGIVSMIDIHRPMVSFPLHWPAFFRIFGNHIFAFMAWQRGTLPLVLRAIWGWQDPTPIFYKAPLVTWYDKDVDKYYGFEISSFNYTTEPWWFGLPLMSTAKILMRKIVLDKEEYEKRVKVFHSLLSPR